MKKWLYSVVTTVALFLVAALGFAKTDSPAKVHADTINSMFTSVEISKSSGERSNRSDWCLGKFSSKSEV